jgi:hypothetical protein
MMAGAPPGPVSTSENRCAGQEVVGSTPADFFPDPLDRDSFLTYG